MGKYIAIFLACIGIGVFFVWLGCETGLNVSLSAAVKTTAEIYHVDAPLYDTDYGFIHIEWTWMVRTPDGDGVIIERSEGSKNKFVVVDTVSPIDTVMSYVDKDTAGIKPQTTYYYRLSLLKGGETKVFSEPEVNTPSTIIFVAPSDTVYKEDSLVVKWKGAVDLEGKLLTNYTLTLMEGSVENPGEVIITQEISEIPEDTIYTWKYPMEALKEYSFYMVKVTSSKIAAHFTDTSTGIKVFFLLGL